MRCPDCDGTGVVLRRAERGQRFHLWMSGGTVHTDGEMGIVPRHLGGLNYWRIEICGCRTPEERPGCGKARGMEQAVFHVGRVQARELWAIARTIGAGALDLAAIGRLERFEGSAEDVLAACALYRCRGEGAKADTLRRGCFGADKTGG